MRNKTKYKKDNYDSIIVIFKRLTKIVHYKPVKTIINIFELVEIIINMII